MNKLYNMLLSGSRSLPSNFAESVIELEEKINLNCSIDLVKDLLDLYSQAIEYYAAKHDPKHLHYQTRIQELLSRKEVAFVLKYPGLELHQYNPRFYKKKPQKKQRKASCDFSNKPLSHQRSADECLKNHNSSYQQLSVKIRENLLKQINSLKNRIVKRKMYTDRCIIRESDRIDE